MKMEAASFFSRYIQEKGCRYCHHSENLNCQTSDTGTQISKFNFWAPYLAEIIMQIAATANDRNLLQ